MLELKAWTVIAGISTLGVLATEANPDIEYGALGLLGVAVWKLFNLVGIYQKRLELKDKENQILVNEVVKVMSSMADALKTRPCLLEGIIPQDWHKVVSPAELSSKESLM